jgi:hypothetical protein
MFLDCVTFLIVKHLRENNHEINEGTLPTFNSKHPTSQWTNQPTHPLTDQQTNSMEQKPSWEAIVT